MSSRCRVIPFVVTVTLCACAERPSVALDDEHGSSSTQTTEDTAQGDSLDSESGSLDGDFVTPLDLFPADCDVLLQDCPPGYKCIPNADLQHSCAQIVGDGQQGEPCTLYLGMPSADNCGAGLFCWDFGCTPLCEGPSNDPTCPPGFDCVTNDQFLGLCAPLGCNPLQPDCPFDWPCIGIGWEAVCVFSDGASPGSTPEGGSCELSSTSFSCNASATCISASSLPDCPSEFCCASWCDPLDPQACAEQPGTTCLSPGNEAYGYCGLP